MSFFRPSSRNRWLMLTLVFGVGPMAWYLILVHPAIVRISSCQDTMALQASAASLPDLGPAPSSDQETEQLREIRLDELSRIKKIDSRESLLRFSGAFTDAVAFQARDFGLRVIGVSLQNPIISGKYIPSNEHAMEALAGLASPQWDELANPLDVPMLQLPSIEMELAVAAEYSQVFSYIESLPDFPTLIQLTKLETFDDSSGKAYRMTLRGYYCGNENIRQTGQSGTQSASNAF